MGDCVSSPEIFLFGLRRLLVLLHAASSVVLLGASTHHLLMMRFYLRRRFERAALEKTYAKVIVYTYAITFGLGLFVYPTYRVHIRGYYLDRFAPVYAKLFDMKEVYAALAMFVALALGALAYTWRPKEEPQLAPVVAAMSFVVCAAVWFSAVVGVLVTSVRGIG
ncbi:MAG: hypothetical protein IPK82_13550 [Polyangiaceae bacterium]|nr:hypothetical protein [Polyangiaceae bacterium]